MSYTSEREFFHRGFKCEIIKINPEETDKIPFYEFCIIEFEKPTTLDKILFFSIGEGVRSDGIAALVDFIGLTVFYPGEFNKDVENIMRIGIMKHEGHIGCYTTDYEGDHWKYMSPSEMEQKLKQDIDIFHDSRKRMINAMKLYRGLYQKMQEYVKQIESGQMEVPKV